jgi:hypothetical protein
MTEAKVSGMRERAVEEKVAEEFESRWQDAIYQLLRKTCGDSIDGGGCDSGDALDFTLSEVSQGLNMLIDRAELAEARVVELEGLQCFGSVLEWEDCKLS